MKKVRLISLLFISLLLFGCNKNVSSVCKKTEKLDSGETVITTETAKYDKDYNLYYSEIETYEKGFTNDETYNMKKKIYDETAKTIRNTSDNYIYEADENEKSFKTKIIIDNYDNYIFITDEDKNNNLGIKNHIKFYEESGYTCEIIGASRKDVGLE